MGFISGEFQGRLYDVSSPTVNRGAASVFSVHVYVSCVSLYCFKWFSVKEMALRDAKLPITHKAGLPRNCTYFRS